MEKLNLNNNLNTNLYSQIKEAHPNILLNRITVAKSIYDDYEYQDDDFILKQEWSKNRHYNQMNFEDFKAKMQEPITIEEHNRLVNNFNSKVNYIMETAGADKINRAIFEEECQRKYYTNIMEKGKIGFVEGLGNGYKNLLSLTPFIGTLQDAWKTRRMNNLIEKGVNGTPLNDDELNRIEDYKKQMEEEAIRGYSIGGRIGAGTIPSLRFMTEFAIIAGLTGGASIKAYALMGALDPINIWNNYENRRERGQLEITERGEIFFKEFKENPFKTILKSMAESSITFATEDIGDKLMPLLNKAPLLKQFNRLMDKTSQKIFGENINRAIKKFGYDGFMGEVVEEWVENPLQFVAGITDDDYTLDNFLKSMEMSMDDLLVISGSVALQGAFSGATVKLMKKITDKYSSDKETDTIKKDKQLLNDIKNMREDDRQQITKELTLKELEEQETTNQKHKQIFKNNLNNFKQQLMSAGTDKAEAEALTTINENMINSLAENEAQKNEIFNIMDLEIKKEKLKNTITTPQQMVDYINNFLSEEYKESLNKDNKTQLTEKELLDILKTYKEAEKKFNKSKSGMSLTQFLSKHGGIYDGGGEIKMYRDEIKNHAPFLLRKTETEANSLDNQFQLALEAGYFQNFKEYDETYNDRKNGVNLLIEAIQSELSGNKIYPSNQRTEAEEYLSQFDEDLYRRGIDLVDLQMLEQLKKGEGKQKANVLNQPMYKAPQNNVVEFVADVLNNNLKKKKYFEYTNKSGITVEITSDTINHDLKRHNFTAKEWEDVLYSLDNILDAKENYKTNYFGDNNIILLTQGNNAKYNIVITQTSGRNKITTAFNIKESQTAHARLYNSGSETSAVPGLTDIINKLKSNVNKNQPLPPFVRGDVVSRGVDDLNSNNTLLQNSSLPRGQISLTDTKATITLFEETHNPSTIIHEMGHFFMKRIEVLAKNGYTKAVDVNKKMNSWLNGEIKRNDYKTNEEYEIAKQEYFARSFEAYLRRGIAPTKELKTVFEKFRELLINIYNSIKELNVKLTPEVIDFFDRLVINNDIIDNNNTKSNEIFKKYQQLQEEIYREREEMANNPLFEEGEIEEVLKEEYGERLDNLEKELTLYQKIETIAENNSTLNHNIDERLNKIEAEIQKGLENRPTTLNDNFYNNLINYTKQENEINNRLTSKAGRYIKNFGKYIKDFSRDTLASADEVINNIDPKLATKLKRMQTDIILITDENKKKALPFFKTMEYIKKTNQNDYLVLDFALKNRDMNKIQELANKYNFYNEYIAIRDLLDKLREQALSVGIDVGYIENYFPRQVDPKKKNEFISFLRANDNGTYNDLLYNLEQLRNNRLFTPEDELRFINNFLRGFVPKDLILLSPNGNLKNPRTIEIITPEINEYFLSSNIALQNYIEATTKDIITREAFGIEDKETQKLRNKLKEKHRQLKRVEETPAGKFKTNQEYKLTVNKAVKEKNLERFTAKEKNKTITPEEMEQLKNIEQEIKDIETQMENFKKLNAFAVKNYHIKQIKKEIQTIQEQLPSDKLENSIAKFINNLGNLDLEQSNLLKKYIANIINPAPSSTLTKFFNNTAYGLALTSFKNAINQLPELAVSFYKNGFFNTVETITHKHKITIEDIGIEDTVSGINKEGLDFINKMLTLTGFNKIDMYGKNTFLNSTLLNTKKELKKNNEAINKDIEQFMTKDAEKVKEDILNDKMSFEVKEYLIMKLAGVQPILMSARPYNYLNNGGLARMLYNLKIFSIKQLNMINQDVMRKITSGDKKEAIEGINNLIRYQAFLFMVGAPVDLIIGLATGYDDDDENLITEAMIDNILIFNIISRYTLAKAGQQGIDYAIMDFFTPVLFRFVVDTARDAKKLITGELEFDNVRTLKYVPFGKDVKALKNIME